jgi:proline iminopeptidase
MDPVADERLVAINGVELFVRELGAGLPIVVLHGGPDFDHTYLLPELDRLAASFRLIYYDQRGRGRSCPDIRPEDVGIESEMADLDALRKQLRLDTVAVLGHSWGCVLAMEYAARHPARVSHLILMNTAPASGDDVERFGRQLRARRSPGDLERMGEIAAGARYAAGDLDAEADYYRIHFRGSVVGPPERVEQIVRRLRTHFTERGVLTAREIERRLYEQTWLRADYDLVPRLRGLPTPTLVLHGAEDLVPVAMAARIAEAMPRARLDVLDGCGHFAYLERPERVAGAINALIDDA